MTFDALGQELSKSQIEALKEWFSDEGGKPFWTWLKLRMEAAIGELSNDALQFYSCASNERRVIPADVVRDMKTSRCGRLTMAKEILSIEPEIDQLLEEIRSQEKLLAKSQENL